MSSCKGSTNLFLTLKSAIRRICRVNPKPAVSARKTTYTISRYLGVVILVALDLQHDGGVVAFLIVLSRISQSSSILETLCFF